MNRFPNQRPRLRSGDLCVAWLAACCVLFSAGCHTEVYRAETTLHTDGQVDRTIFQPRERTPETVRSSTSWAWTRTVHETEADSWEQGIADLPLVDGETERPYFAASGRFASATELPEHFVKLSHDQKLAGKFVRQFERNQYPLVSVFLWKETLTDIVTLEGFNAARSETLDTLLALAVEIMQQAFGDQHDFSRVEAWLRDDVRRLLVQLSDSMYELSARREPERDEKLQQRLIELTRQRGLQIVDEQGKLLQGDAFEGAVRDYLGRKLKELIVRKDGMPVDDEVIRVLQQGLRDRPEDVPLSDAEKRLDAAGRAALQKRFGTDEAFEQWMTGKMEQILGVYQSELLGPPRRFYYKLTVPGLVVESSGKLGGDNVVSWEFSARDAYPLGYEMSCRSLLPDRDAQQALLGRTPLLKREQLAEYTQCIEKSEELRKALEDCMKFSSLAPLEHYLVEAEKSHNARETALARKVWNLLGPPE